MIVVGLSGVAGVGKDVGAAALVRDLGFVRIGFADALREALYRLNPIVAVPFHLGLSADGYATLRYVVNTLGWDVAKREIEDVRVLQQRMGTEVGREIFGQDVWVEALYRRATQEGVKHLVIPDVRFPNELASVVDCGGICYRIVRPGFAPINDHASDNALTNLDFPGEVTVHNDGTEETYQDYLVRSVAILIQSGWLSND